MINQIFFKMPKQLIFCLAVTLFVSHAHGHGRMMDPPGRSTMWRFGFPTEPNYTDMGLNCGGRDVQYLQNGGRCGICGDNYADPSPRQNEYGGIYGTGLIAKSYDRGQAMPVWVQLTAAHKGYFEFGLCDLSSPTQPESDDCFQTLTLEGGAPHFNVETFEPANYTMSVQLPSDVTCERCVLRWHYKTGNFVGECSDGTSSIECADQEIFRNCVDIAIH